MYIVECELFMEFLPPPKGIRQIKIYGNLPCQSHQKCDIKIALSINYGERERKRERERERDFLIPLSSNWLLVVWKSLKLVFMNVCKIFDDTNNRNCVDKRNVCWYTSAPYIR